MNLDADRLSLLAGITTQYDYRDKKLNEMEARIVLTPSDQEEQAMVDQLTANLGPEEVEVEPANPEASGAVASGEALPTPAEDEALPVPEEEEALEERLRRIIRTEVRQIVSEEISKRDEKQITYARKNKSVAAAMGFSSFGARGGTTPSGPTKSWSPTLGFPGPGFKQ
jgi:hypothetical protein